MLTSTLYPKIGKLSDFVHRSRSLDRDLKLPLVGTVKLQGTHADIVIGNDDNVRIQSRNRADLTVEDDNLGFAAFAMPLREIILALKDRALVQLPRHLVIISVRINGFWVPDQDYAELKAEPVGIYNISKAGFFYDDLNLANIDDSEAKLGLLVKNVGRGCPYALTFGVSRIGEGIVWKSCELCGDPQFWFKSKEEEFVVEAAKKPGFDLEKLRASERVNEFAKMATTVNRMQPGWDFLKEIKIPQDRSWTGRFLSWLIDDCSTEEGREIEEAEIDKAKFKSAICLIGRGWYKERVHWNGARS